MHPRARRKGLIVKTFPQQTFVYELMTDKVHTLGRIAASVYALADGRLSLEELTVKVQEDCEIPVDVDAVKLALERLLKVKLIENWPPEKAAVGLSRRVALRRMAVALAVTTFLAPGASWAGITS